MITSPLGLTLAIALGWLAIAALQVWWRSAALALVAHVLYPLGAALGLGARRRGARRDRRPAAHLRRAARPARPAVPFPDGRAVGVLPVPARRGRHRGVGVRRRPRARGRRHRAGRPVLLAPPVSRQHGVRARRRRRLRLHGRLGVDGGVVVLPRHDRPPAGGDPARGLPLPADRAHRRDRDPAVFRRPAGRHQRLHLRRDARRAARALLGHRGVPPRPLRLRREGRHPAAARMAARGAPRGALAGFGADERGDAQDRDLRDAAGHVRSPAYAGLVVGRHRARDRARDRDLRRGLQRGAERHEAPARLLVDREHRLHRRRLRPHGDLRRLLACARSPHSR